eukprot:2035557-Amphidinium_carterae.1
MERQQQQHEMTSATKLVATNNSSVSKCAESKVVLCTKAADTKQSQTLVGAKLDSAFRLRWE